MSATILASALITKADNILNDAGATRWPNAEMLDWLNDAEREIATTVIECNTKIVNVTLAAGTKQALPADTIQLVDVMRNMGAGGTTPGEVPRPADMTSLSRHNPQWHTDTATLVVKNWMYDPQVQDVFYVYPPMSGATQLEVKYAALPASVATVGAAISIDDIYANDILDYMLYRAFLKDAALTGMLARSQAHWTAFARSVSAQHAEAPKEAE